MIRRLLIANRGEIARRIARTCRRLGIDTVAVYSDADAAAPHVADCDVAVRLPGVTSADTYLRIDRLIDAARTTGADAVHPGYGFLAENAEFARAVIDAGLVWVGPPPEAIAAMGDKLAAKRTVAAAGVPVLDSVEITSDADLEAAQRLGLPLLVKAAAGGGGKGMRIVRDAAELADAVAACRREAAGAFGDDRVFVEPYLDRPRHIEVQIFGDAHGNLIHLFERECSIQRRHQKVIEETPSVALTEELRKAMGDAAVTVGRAIGYHNAGTVEFIFADGRYYFLEVNTRLQVEHPVTEEVVRTAGGGRIDLVEWQLRVAAGEPLPATADELLRHGHAIEARLYAEDPANGYLPASGTLRTFLPDPSVRWDSGVESGTEVSPYYDPLLAKAAAWAPTREEAADRLARALRRTLIDGVRTNRDLLVAVLSDPVFRAGETTTHFLEERYPTDADRTFPPDPGAVERGAVAAVLHGMVRRAVARRVLVTLPPAWRSHPLDPEEVRFVAAGREVVVRYERRRDGRFDVEVDGRPHDAAVVEADGDRLVVDLDGVRYPVRVSAHGVERHVLLPDGQVSLIEQPRFPPPARQDIPGATTSPMPGTVVTVAVEVGQQVSKGDLLCIVEAMKMEHRITAPHDGVVTEVRAAPGAQVDGGEILVVVEPASA